MNPFRSAPAPPARYRASSGKESSGESYPDPDPPPPARAASSTSDNVGSLIRRTSGLFCCPTFLSPADPAPPAIPPGSDGVNPGVLSALPIPPNAAGDVTCRPKGRPMYRAAALGAGLGKSPGESTSPGGNRGSLADGVIITGPGVVLAG